MNTMRILMLAALLPAVCEAGTRYEIKCSTGSCGYASSIGIGGGMRFEEASGYCRKCDQIVSATWRRGEKKTPLLMEIWDALAGKARRIFPCPKCKAPFVKVDQIAEFRFCPKCGKESLKSRRTLLYD